MKTRIFILLVAFMLIVSGVGIYLFLTRPTEDDGVLSNEEFISVITQDYPLFVKDDKPVIEIIETKQPTNQWYVVSIKSIQDETGSVPVRVLYKQDDNKKLRLIAGPENHFSEADLLKYNVPDSVIIELQKT